MRAGGPGLEAAMAGQPVEHVRPHLGHLDQARTPDLSEAGHVEVGCVADLLHDLAVQRALGDTAGAAPGGLLTALVHGAVAGEAELAFVGGGPLEHHAADALGEAGPAHPVQHHLGDGRLAAVTLATGLVVDGVGQAIERALTPGHAHVGGGVRSGHGDLHRGRGRRQLREGGGGGHRRGLRRRDTHAVGFGERRLGRAPGEVGGDQHQAEPGSGQNCSAKRTRVHARREFNRQCFRVLFGEGEVPPDFDARRTDSLESGGTELAIHDKAELV